MPELKTDQALLTALQNASSREPGHEQLERQRLSFVMGTLPEENDMTRDQVLDVLERQEGRKLAF
jgi:hypothetical protein